MSQHMQNVLHIVHAKGIVVAVTISLCTITTTSSITDVDAGEKEEGSSETSHFGHTDPNGELGGLLAVSHGHHRRTKLEVPWVRMGAGRQRPPHLTQKPQPASTPRGSGPQALTFQF